MQSQPYHSVAIHILIILALFFNLSSVPAYLTWSYAPSTNHQCPLSRKLSCPRLRRCRAISLTDPYPNSWRRMTRKKQHIASGWLLTSFQSTAQNTDSNDDVDRREESMSSPLDKVNKKRPIISFARAGGRSKKDDASLSTDNLKSRVRKIAKMIAPFLFLLFLARWTLGILFSPGSSPPSYVYYQRTLYESSSYNSQSGKVERTRKENFRSNIPSLISGQRSIQQGDQGSSISSYLLEASPDEELDRELDVIFPEFLIEDFFN